MIKELNSEEIVKELNRLPEDVLFVLSSKSETEANIKLKNEFGFNEEKSKIVNAFYLSILFKINSISDFPLFIKDKLGIADQSIVVNMLKHFLMRFYNFDNYLPETISFFNELNLPIPSQPPLINKARKTRELQEQELRKAQASSRMVENVDMTIGNAIKSYPDLGEKILTSSPIKLKIFPQPVRPSIKNWIEDYRSTMGAERHGMMERGNYLFHTENTKRLTSGERKKLAEVLRSLDEDVTLKIDPDRQEIVFEQTAEEAKPAGNTDNISNFSAQSKPISGWQDKIAKKTEISQNIPNSSFQTQGRPQQSLPSRADETPSQTRNFPASRSASLKFSSPHTFPSEKKESNPLLRQTGEQINQPDSNRSYQQSPRRYPSFNDSQAGRPWEPEEEKNDPKIRGNTVDLRN